MIWKFTINGLLHSLNDSLSGKRADAWREKKRWRLDAALAALAAGVQKASGPRTVTYTRYATRLLDPDNLAGAFKHVQDGLVDARALVGDKQGQVRPVYCQDLCPRGQERITIEVSD